MLIYTLVIQITYLYEEYSYCKLQPMCMFYYAEFTYSLQFADVDLFFNKQRIGIS